MSSTAFTRPRVTTRSQSQILDENAIKGKSAVTETKSRVALATLSSNAQATRPTGALKPAASIAQRSTTVLSNVPTRSTAAPISTSNGALKPRRTALPVATKPVKVPTPKAAPIEEIIDEDSMDEMDEAKTRSEDDLSLEDDNEPMDIDSMDEDSTEMKDLAPVKSNGSKVLKNIEDIDEADADDVQFCVEYVEDIFAHFKEKEQGTPVDTTYMEKQVDLSAKYRTIMVDWMAEVCVKFQLLSETLFLSVNIIDRFLSHKAVARSRLQLVGVAAMLIASKFEEIYTPKVDDFIYFTANAYTREELLKMEKLILITLDFNLNVPSPIHFLRRFSKAAHSDSRAHTLGKYLIELTILDYELLNFLPSEIAASATYIARAMMRPHGSQPIWNDTIEHYTGYSVEDIMPCIRRMNELAFAQNSAGYKYTAIQRKYASNRLMSVSLTATVRI
ncbi:hypothetical protein PROFUN_12383 [Planoprotostelium fungivorum]|uniref:Uncharacterized protein n=1 Tax=Planoprotostelium fungivorum TaxID=1890364 RepID=A0A2P6N7G7_9EUKA|nr:hypothetical protein PROFUN_12383 [Planoprotostelium fungivorum]